MEDTEWIKRAEDLRLRSARKGVMTATPFLTPAERALLERSLHPEPGVTMLFYGGYEDCERSVAFFIPEEDCEDEERLHDRLRSSVRAVRYKAYFGTPGHRDYLGAILGSGIARNRIGDLLIEGDEATVFCLPGVLFHLLTIDRIGRTSVRAEEIRSDELVVPARELQVKSISVMSMRLDAVAAGVFNLSRTVCVRHIAEGSLSLNYAVCLKPDTPVKIGDVISIRGFGKGKVTGIGGTSRKGRQFVQVSLYR